MNLSARHFRRAADGGIGGGMDVFMAAIYPIGAAEPQPKSGS
jgi:hypothetical protein